MDISVSNTATTPQHLITTAITIKITPLMTEICWYHKDRVGGGAGFYSFSPFIATPINTDTKPIIIIYMYKVYPKISLNSTRKVCTGCPKSALVGGIMILDDSFHRGFRN